MKKNLELTERIYKEGIENAKMEAELIIANAKKGSGSYHCSGRKQRK